MQPSIHGGCVLKRDHIVPSELGDQKIYDVRFCVLVIGCWLRSLVRLIFVVCSVLCYITSFISCSKMSPLATCAAVAAVWSGRLGWNSAFGKVASKSIRPPLLTLRGRFFGPLCVFVSLFSSTFASLPAVQFLSQRVFAMPVVVYWRETLQVLTCTRKSSSSTSDENYDPAKAQYNPVKDACWPESSKCVPLLSSSVCWCPSVFIAPVKCVPFRLWKLLTLVMCLLAAFSDNCKSGHNWKSHAVVSVLPL